MHPYMRANLVKVLAGLQTFHRAKPLTLVSGDVHLSSATRLCYSHNAIEQDCIPAYLTSGLTSGAAAVSSLVLLTFDAWLHWPLAPHFAQLVTVGDKLVREKWHVEVDGVELINNYLTLEWNNDSALLVVTLPSFPLVGSWLAHGWCACRCSGTLASTSP